MNIGYWDCVYAKIRCDFDKFSVSTNFHVSQFEIKKRRSQAEEYKYLLKARERPRRSQYQPTHAFSAATIHNNNFLPQFLAGFAFFII